MKAENLPEELKQCKAWVCWKKVPDEKRPGGFKKVPINPLTGYNAKSSDPITWTDFHTAYEQMQKRQLDGLGFMFSGSGYVGIDIDHCIDGSKPSDFAKEIIESLDSYTEISPSGTGVHIICKGTMPTGGNRNDNKGLEMYNQGRYFTMTGFVLPSHNKVEERQEAIEAIHQKYIAKKSEAPKMGGTQPPQVILDNMDNARVVELASKSKQGTAFLELYNGNWQGKYESPSQADMAFMNMLAFWTRCDADQMDSIFRESGLMRPKWDKQRGVNTYGNNTITKAIDDCTRMYGDMLEQRQPQNREQQPAAGGQTDFPLLDKNQKPLKKHWKNTEHLCNQLGIIFRFNELTKQIEVEHKRLTSLSFDAMVTEMLGICHEYDFRVIRADLIDHIGRISEKNKYNPVQDYLTECRSKWDGKTRIQQLFDCFILDPNIPQDEKLLYKLFKKWLVTCVVMAFNDGTKATQGALILCGAQGIGKTRWMFYILPNAAWGKEGVSIDFKQKDDIIRAVSYWIVELGEIGSTMRREKLDRLKAFITEKTDAIRMPYGRAMERRPRNTVFIGTVNNDTFLKDDTGERRNWVISLVDIKLDMTLDMHQLWGEVAHLALEENYPYWIDEAEINALNAQNETYKVASPEEQLLMDSLDWDCRPEEWIYINATDMCKLLGLPNNKNVAMGRALKRLSVRGIKCPWRNDFKKYYCPTFKDKELLYQATYRGISLKLDLRIVKNGKGQ